MNSKTLNLLPRMVAFALIGLISLGLSAGVSHADGTELKLGISPLDYEGAYFDLTLQPGETQELTVEVGNYGADAVVVRTYAADAYTVVNGGFGARLDSEPTSGATLWVNYLPQTIELPAGEAIQRTFAVSVPADTPPGEYATSLVVQSAVATSAEGTGVLIQQVQRSAIAIAIMIPGPRTPLLSIDGVNHSVVAGTSIVSFVVTNSGNVRIRPSGEFILRDEDGLEVARFPIFMDTFYAGTSTTVEVPFDGLLLKGAYTASLNLRHSDRVQESGQLALTVTKAEIVPIVQQDASNGSKRATANQSAKEEARWYTRFGWPLLLLSGAVVLVLVCGSLLLLRARRLGEVTAGRNDHRRMS